MVKKEPLLNLTVEQILTMGDEALNKTNKRQLSHMLRTVSLAANKRITRLENNERKGGIATDALEAVRDSGGRFSVGNKNRNQIYAELARAREFMNYKTSTITGAIEVRKDRERRAFGQTREEMEKERNKRKREYDKRERAKARKAKKQGHDYTPQPYIDTVPNYDDRLKKIYKAYRMFRESNYVPSMRNKNKGQYGSDNAIAEIGRMIKDNPSLSIDEMAAKAERVFTEQYEKEQEIATEATSGRGFTI